MNISHFIPLNNETSTYINIYTWIIETEPFALWPRNAHALVRSEALNKQR